jgi:hypothetical protein
MAPAVPKSLLVVGPGAIIEFALPFSTLARCHGSGAPQILPVEDAQIAASAQELDGRASRSPAPR